MGKQQVPHTSSSRYVLNSSAHPPHCLPHNRPFHSSGMCLETSFTPSAFPRGVGTRNPHPSKAELNDPIDRLTHTTLNNFR